MTIEVVYSTKEPKGTIIAEGRFKFKASFCYLTKDGFMEGTWTSNMSVVDPTYGEAAAVAVAFLTDTGDQHHVYFEGVGVELLSEGIIILHMGS